MSRWSEWGWESSLQRCNREKGLKLFCVKTLFGVHESVHGTCSGPEIWIHAGVLTVLVFRGAPGEQCRYPHIEIPTVSGPFLSVKHNHTLQWPGCSGAAGIACKAGHLCFPGFFLFSAVYYPVNCLWAPWRKECSLILCLCKASCIEVLALAGF